jgi:hypothetical protein
MAPVTRLSNRPRRPLIACFMLTPMLLGGCTSLLVAEPCLDASFKRESKPIAGVHSFQVRVRGMEPVRTTITCERYYEAGCSARGNSWEIREVGASNYIPRSLEFHSPEGEAFTIDLPPCSALAGDGGIHYQAWRIKRTRGPREFVYRRSEGTTRIYLKQYPVTEPKEVLRLDLDVWVDGRPVEWPVSRPES